MIDRKNIEPQHLNGNDIDQVSDEWIDDQQVQISQEARDTYEEMFENTGWQKFLLFLAAENKAGRWFNVALDAVAVFAPAGVAITKVKDFVEYRIKKELNMKEALKTALTKHRGSWLRVRDENGKIDGVAVLAALIKIVLLSAGLLLIHVVGTKLGLDMQMLYNQFIEAARLLLS